MITSLLVCTRILWLSDIWIQQAVCFCLNPSLKPESRCPSRDSVRFHPIIRSYKTHSESPVGFAITGLLCQTTPAQAAIRYQTPCCVGYPKVCCPTHFNTITNKQIVIPSSQLIGLFFKASSYAEGSACKPLNRYSELATVTHQNGFTSLTYWGLPLTLFVNCVACRFEPLLDKLILNFVLLLMIMMASRILTRS